MSDIDDIKEMFTETQKSVKDLQDAVAELQKAEPDVVDEERIAKMEEDVAAKMEEEQKSRTALAAKVAALETKSARPGAPETKDTYPGSPEAKAFQAYLRKGTEPREIKALTSNSAEDGGFYVPITIRDGIQERLRRTSPVRQVATVVAIDGTAYDTFVERGDAGYQWAGENQARDNTDTPTVNRITIALHELSAMPKASQRLLDTASFDIETWLQARVVDRFERAEALAYISGDGVNMPKGILAYGNAAVPDETRATGILQSRNTGVNGDFAAVGPVDVFVNTFYDLHSGYQANASWMMKSTTMAKVATLKDGDGRYLLQEMLNGSGAFVRTIQGRPAYVADDMPALAANALAVAVGDFQAGYTIVDGASISVLRDPFSSKPNVLFYTTKRTGGGVTDFDAIKLIKFAA